MNHRIGRIPPVVFFFTIMITATVTPSASVSWSVHEKRLTAFDFFDGHSSITQLNNGEIWIIWSQDTFANLTLVYRTSSDLGGTWSDEINLTKVMGPGQDTSPSIIQTMDGTIWVVWQSDRPPPPRPPGPDFTLDASPASLTIPKNSSDTSTITVTSLRDFNAPVDLTVFFDPPGVITTLDPTQVTPPPNGTATSTLTVAVEPNAFPGDYTLTVNGANEELGLSHAVDIALEITESAAAGAGGDTAGYRSSSETEQTTYDYEIYYRKSSDYGATWSNTTQLTTNLIDDGSPSITQLMNGTLLVVWQSNGDIFLKTSSDGGVSWSNAEHVTTDPNPDRSPSITQMEDGRIWLFWHSNRTGDNEVLYKIYDDSWSDDTTLTNSANEDYNPSILQTLNGTIWVFWDSCEPTGLTSDLHYMTSSDNGATWSGSNQFSTDPYDDVWPSVTQTNDAKIWVVWTSNRADQPYGNWDIWYRTSLAADLNNDGFVDHNDLAKVGDAYGSTPGDDGWDEAADINKDDIVDIYDLAIVGRDYGET